MNDNILRSALATKMAYSSINMKTITPLSKCSLYGNEQMPCRIINANIYTLDSGTNSKMIAFRGSNSFKDILDYADTRTCELHMRDKIIKVHSNIVKLFFSLENELTNYIFDDVLTYRKKTLTFCGHSRGGAAAMLAAAYYGDITGDNVTIKCHTFASPKVGDSSFIEWYHDNVDESINVVNEHDPIRYIPFSKEYIKNPDLVILKDNTCNLLKAHDMDTYKELIINEMNKKYSNI